MKLRKAIDKAKEARKEDTPGKSNMPIEKKDDASNKELIAPTYSESKSVGLNQKIMEENRCVCMLPESLEINYYKVLRTQIQQLAIEKKWTTFMITSAHPGEGKTLTSINLALT
ncbi:MAG: tyrosine protein kinase, partial [bacterium]